MWKTLKFSVKVALIVIAAIENSHVEKRHGVREQQLKNSSSDVSDWICQMHYFESPSPK